MMSKSKVPQIRFEGFLGEWEEKEFSKTFTNISNNTLSRAELNYNSGLARNVHYGDVLIKFGELLDVEKEEIPFIINNDFVSKFKSSKLQDGDIIIADAAEDEMVGKCTEVVNIKEEIIFAGLHTIAVRPAFSFASKYLGYYMNSPLYHNQLLPLLQGTKVLSISKSAIKNTMIYSPADSLEQTKIGNYFQQLDKLIEEKEKKHQKLKQFKKAMLDKMFPKNGANTPEIRFEGFCGEWEEKELDIITDVRDGTHDSPKYISEGHPFITSRNIKNGRINLDDIQYISDKDFNDINKRSKVDKNDILMGMIGTIGNIALVLESPNFAIKNVALIKDRKIVYSLYLYNYLQSSIIIKQLDEGMEGGTQKFISLNKVRHLLIFIPTNTIEQTKIGNYFQTLDKQIDLQNKEIEKLKNIKKASLDKMFV